MTLRVAGDKETLTPLVTIAIPSLNQGCFLEDALISIFAQKVPVEVMLADAGSTDGTAAVIEKWSHRLTWWRSAPDGGQAAAINEAITMGSAPYVAWLNADDTYLPDGLTKMLACMERCPEAAVVYGKVWNTDSEGKYTKAYETRPFSEWWLARYCYVSQPGTLIRRQVWESVGGLDENLNLAMDYDLWWKIVRKFGALSYLPEFVATNRVHGQTKTSSQRRSHYLEAMSVVRKYSPGLPWKWRLFWPWAVWMRSTFNRQR